LHRFGIGHDQYRDGTGAGKKRIVKSLARLCNARLERRTP
jgi:hypothetical protein